jgi:hypothetical protein
MNFVEKGLFLIDWVQPPQLLDNAEISATLWITFLTANPRDTCARIGCGLRIRERLFLMEGAATFLYKDEKLEG